jgi:hypothetical protein
MNKMIACMLKNTTTGRFHPIFFRLAPMPGGADSDLRAQRYRSYGHHTEGFLTEEDAIVSAQATCKQSGAEFRPICWDWDGESIPAMVEFFEAEIPTPGMPGSPGNIGC